MNQKPFDLVVNAAGDIALFIRSERPTRPISAIVLSGAVNDIGLAFGDSHLHDWIGAVNAEAADLMMQRGEVLVAFVSPHGIALGQPAERLDANLGAALVPVRRIG